MQLIFNFALKQVSSHHFAKYFLFRFDCFASFCFIWRSVCFSFLLFRFDEKQAKKFPYYSLLSHIDFHFDFSCFASNWKRAAQPGIVFPLPSTNYRKRVKLLSKSRQQSYEFSSLPFTVALQLCVDISISPNSRNLFQFLQFSYCTLKERKNVYLSSSRI